MTTHSNQFPGTGSASGTPAWQFPTRIEVDDANLAYVDSGDMPIGQISGYLLATNFGFDAGGNEVPPGATIDGIKVYIEKRCAQADMHDNVVSMWTGSAVGDNKADTSTGWPSALTEVSYGSVTPSSEDDWNASLTDTDVRASSFGVAFKCKNDNGIFNAQPFCNYIKIDIAFTNPLDLDCQVFILATILILALLGQTELIGSMLATVRRKSRRVVTGYAREVCYG